MAQNYDDAVQYLNEQVAELKSVLANRFRDETDADRERREVRIARQMARIERTAASLVPVEDAAPVA